MAKYLSPRSQRAKRPTLLRFEESGSGLRQFFRRPILQCPPIYFERCLWTGKEYLLDSL